MARNSIGSAYYELLLSNESLLKGFAESEAQARIRSKKISAAIDAEMKRIEGSFARVEKAGSFKLNLAVDTRAGEAAVKRLQAQLGSIKQGQSLNLTINGAQAESTLGRIRQSITAAERRGANIRVNLDTREAERRLAGLQARATAPSRGGITRGDAFQFAAVAAGASALGAGGLIVGATALHGAITSVTEATARQRQAQFALNELYGESAGVYTRFAQEQSDALKINSVEFIEAASRLATLNRNYALSSEQIKKLILISTNLAAVKGITIPEAAGRVEGALRGEAEAIEYLGQTLNSDYLKALSDISSAERKRFETMSPLLKAQLVLNELTKQSADLQDAAAKQADSATGSFKALEKGTQELGAVVGGYATPAVEKLAGWFGAAASAAADYLKFEQAISDEARKAPKRGFGLFGPASRSTPAASPTSPRAAGATPGVGGTGRAGSSAADVAAAARDAENERKRIAQAELEAGQDQVAKLQKIAEAATEAQLKEYDIRRDSLERLRTKELTDLEDKEKAELRSIETLKQAALDANRDQIEAAERAKDVALRSAEQRHDGVIRALESETAAFRRARELEDRTLQDTRAGEDRGLDDRRTAFDLAFDAEREGALESLAAQEEARSRGVAAEIREIERRKDAALRNFDQEAEAARDNADTRIRAIEESARAEDQRHQQAMDNLAAEEARQLGAIDKRLTRLDTAERKAGESERDAELKAARSRADRSLAAALRVGDPAAIAAARKAQAEAAAAIEKEATQRSQNALRRKLQSEQEEIRKSFDARRKIEEQENERRADRFEEEKRQIRDTLDAALEVIGVRRQKAEDDTAAELERIRQRDQADKDTHDAEVKRVTEAFELRQRTRDADRLEEDRALAASRLAEDRTLADGRAAQDADLAARKQASDDALEAERLAVEEQYSGPEGILTILRKATETIGREYAARQLAAQTYYDDEKRRINDIYTNTDNNGLLDRLETAKGKTKDSLDAQKELWKDWSLDTVEKVKAAADELERFLGLIGGLDSIGVVAPRPPRADGAAVDQALPRGGAGGLAYGPVVKNASDNSYWTSDGTHGGHPAADIFAPAGSPIYAPVDGTLDSYTVPLGGNAATMIGADGRAYYFAHARGPMASGPVKRGQQIGEVGNSGNAAATAAHLHFAISKSGAGTFDRLNGSGDVMGDASYWGSGGVGVGTGEGEWVTVELFGRKYRIFTGGNGGILGDVGAGAGGIAGMALIRAIEKLGTGIRNQDFGYAGAAIAHSEGAAGDLTQVGDGGSRGPYQFHPRGELPAYAKYLNLPLNDAGNYAGAQPLHAADWALRGYLGRALNAGIEQGIRGAPLAVYGSRYGQKPREGLWEKAGDSFRQLYGFKDGGIIKRESLLIDSKTGKPWGKIAEGNRAEGVIGQRALAQMERQFSQSLMPHGGPIPEPTLLYGLRQQRSYDHGGQDWGAADLRGAGSAPDDGKPLVVQVVLNSRVVAEEIAPDLRAIRSHGITLRQGY